jgi:ditrans,polycis-polyprenyl diphosphate synthase
LRLNIRCVSAYAFSIENFKRSEEEVAALMKLAEEKLLELCQHGYSLLTAYSQFCLSYTCRDLLDEHGVRLNVVGKIELLPQSVQRAIRKAENMTRHNNR